MPCRPQDVHPLGRGGQPGRDSFHAPLSCKTPSLPCLVLGPPSLGSPKCLSSLLLPPLLSTLSTGGTRPRGGSPPSVNAGSTQPMDWPREQAWLAPAVVPSHWPPLPTVSASSPLLPLHALHLGLRPGSSPAVHRHSTTKLVRPVPSSRHFLTLK